MQASVQPWALTVDRILDHAAAARPRVEIFTAAALGAPSRTDYAELAVRVRRLAGALAADGVRRGDRVVVIGANTACQLEAWYAVMGLGAVCCPLNPSLPPEALAAQLAEASPRAVFIEPALAAAVEPALSSLPRLERVILMAEKDEPAHSPLHKAIGQDAYVDLGSPLDWANLDETAPAVVIRTAGSGEPARTVTWSHRSCVLEALIAAGPDALGLSDHEAILPLVPFWRAAAWGVLFAAPTVGAKLVLPGRRTDAQSIRVLADREAATLVIGPPAELQALHDQYRSESRQPNGLKRVIAVGAPCPSGLAKAWRDNFGVETSAAWGLAESSALGTVYRPGSMGDSPPFGMELQIVGHDGRAMPRDGASVGRLRARGAVIAGNAAGAGVDGFVDTGDLASIDAEGRVRILGRADALVLAAGGLAPAELIEAAALDHPTTAMAAAIDAPSGLAEDGPVLVVARKAGAAITKPELLKFLGDRLGPATPKDVLWVDGFPLDQAGRVDRVALRERLERLGRQAEPIVAPALLAAAAAAEVAEPPETAPPPSVQAAAEAIAAERSLEPAAALAATAAAAPVVYLAEHDAPASDRSDQDWSGHDPVAAEPPAPSAGASIEAPGAPVAPVEVATEPEPPPPSGLAGDEEPASPSPPPPVVAVAPQEAPRSTALALLQSPAQAVLAETAAPEEPMRQLRVPGPPPEAIGGVEDFHPAPSRRRSEGAVWAKWFLTLTSIIAAIPVALVAAIAIALRLGLIDWRSGLSDLTLDWPYRFALVGLVSGLLAIFAALFAGFGRFWRRALFSLAAPVAVMGGLIWLSLIQQAYPPLHDVATDWNHPIPFSHALIAARGPRANPVEADPVIAADGGRFMNRRVAEVNADTCPQAHSIVLPVTEAEAFNRAKTAVTGAGLTVLTDEPEEGRIEATGSNLLFGFRNDLAVRIQPQGGESRIDLRSSSRESPYDFGSNCAQVSRLVAMIQGQ